MQQSIKCCTLLSVSIYFKLLLFLCQANSSAKDPTPSYLIFVFVIRHVLILRIIIVLVNCGIGRSRTYLHDRIYEVHCRLEQFLLIVPIRTTGPYTNARRIPIRIPNLSSTVSIFLTTTQNQLHTLRGSLNCAD